MTDSFAKSPIRRMFLLATFGIAMALASCSSPRSTPSTAVPAVSSSGFSEAQLLPVSAYPGDFQWQQRVTATWPEGKRSFSAVLSKADGALRLVGLDPMGRVGFTLELGPGQRVKLESHASVRFPFDPRFIILDVQRIFYPWSERPLEGGRRRVVRPETVIVEEVSEGRLKKRIFEQRGERAQIEGVVTYEYEKELAGVPSRATYQNLLRGYRLVIDTFDAQTL